MAAKRRRGEQDEEKEGRHGRQRSWGGDRKRCSSCPEVIVVGAVVAVVVVVTATAVGVAVVTLAVT